jgi:hypothetical protein
MASEPRVSDGNGLRATREGGMPWEEAMKWCARLRALEDILYGLMPGTADDLWIQLEERKAFIELVRTMNIQNKTKELADEFHQVFEQVTMECSTTQSLYLLFHLVRVHRDWSLAQCKAQLRTFQTTQCVPSHVGASLRERYSALQVRHGD